MSEFRMGAESKLALSVAANIALAGLGWALWRNNRLLRESDKRDSKTGLLDYPHFRSAVVQKLNSRRANDQGKVHGLLLGDIDDFGGLNERLLYEEVDEKALIPAAQKVKSVLRPNRPNDLAGRFGGDEFVIFLGNTDNQGTAAVAGKLHGDLSQIRPFEGSAEGLESSIAYMSVSHGDNYDQCFELLNLALKAAKQNGKNQIVDAKAMVA